ncbi:MAG: 3-methyl-2-oxobutanoate dehydrogenase subunit VorB [Anaerolineae bacterium]
MAKELLKGNVAIAEAAIRSGLNAYFGYPTTPETEILAYMAQRMPQLGRVFLQAESAIAAINMVYGAACSGVRTMTSSSGLGISLMQEGLVYIVCSEVPAVVIDSMRGWPGLGSIYPSQADYNQLTKSAGHGDFHSIVLAPSSIQEAVDLTVLAFDLAEKYRTLVIVTADSIIGQLMEPVELPPLKKPESAVPEWALTGATNRPKKILSSLYLDPTALENINRHMQDKQQRIKADEVRYEAIQTADADILIVAFGAAGRVAKTTVREARRYGIRVGLLRPISLFPFPTLPLRELALRAHAIMVVEMNAGQMVEDVRLAVGNRALIHFHGSTGGLAPLPDELLERIAALHTNLHEILSAGVSKTTSIPLPIARR